MVAPTAEAAYAALYGVSSEELVRTLPMIAEDLHARLVALAQAPTPEAADQLVRDAGGLVTLGMKIGAALRREAQPQDLAA